MVNSNVTDGRITAWLRRNVKWKKWSPYYRSSLIHVETTDYGRLYSRGNQYYLVHNDEIGKIPRYMALTLMNVYNETGHWGPYTFYNGFDATPEAQYLMKMFRYPQLTDRARQKVADIRFDYNMWFTEDESFIKAMEARYGVSNG